MRTHGWWMAVSLGLAALVGCGGGDAGEEGVVAEAPSEEGIKRRSAANLPKVGEYMPVLDDGKVELAPPADWSILSRDARYLARFAKGKQNELPRITVSSGDTPDPSVTDLTPENYEQMANLLMKQMVSEKKLIEEPCRPIYVGDKLFLRHVRRASLGGDPVVLQSLQTVHGGRIYTIELVCTIDAPRAEEYEGSLKKYRDLGYAVAANMRYVGDAPAETTPEPAPAAAPAEENAKP